MKAASDPTSSAILTLLAQNGPGRVTDLAKHSDMRLNAVSKHIKVLERAGPVTRRTEWREHIIELNMAPLRQVDLWLNDLRSIWALRLEALDDLFNEDTANDDT